MRNQITIDSKIGYLRPRTGRYDWAVVIEFTEDGVKLMDNKGQHKRNPNIWEQKTTDIIKWLTTPSPDFQDGRPLLKHKGCNTNH